MFKPDHKHILLQGFISHVPKEIEIKEWLINLVKHVRMEVVAGPVSKYVLDQGNEGVTGVIVGTILLATSHAAIHIWDAMQPAYFQFDLYSCTNFSTTEVIEYFKKSLDLQAYKYMYINRNDMDFKIIKAN